MPVSPYDNTPSAQQDLTEESLLRFFEALKARGYTMRKCGTGRVLKRDGTERQMTAAESAAYDAPLMQSLTQCKEFE